MDSSLTHQWRKALRFIIRENCAVTRFHTSWMAVLFPTKVADIFNPTGATLQIEALVLMGIHSTKRDESLLTALASIDLVGGDVRPPEHAGAGHVAAWTRCGCRWISERERGCGMSRGNS